MKKRNLFLISMFSVSVISMPVWAGSSYFDGIVQTHRANTLVGTHISAEAQEIEKISKGAETFIDKLGKSATGFLAADTLTDSQKSSKFRQLLRSSFDMQTIARFSLGRYWRVATDSEQKEYLKLFENMVVDVYTQRFSEYDGQALEVRGSRYDGKRDVIVKSFIVDEAGSEFRVDWRVRHKSGRYKVVDVIIEGVSMSVTQRSDFSSVIQRGGGEVKVLLAHLREN